MVFFRCCIVVALASFVNCIQADESSSVKNQSRAVFAGEAQVEWIKTPRPSPVPSTPADAPGNVTQGPSTEWTVALADRSFYQTMLRWTRTAGWQLVWEVDRDFPIDAQVTLHGTFLEAVGLSMNALLETDFPLQSQVNEKTRVLRITRYILEGERQ